MGNEQNYNINLKLSEVRETQLALLYHIDNVLIPFYEEQANHFDYHPTQEVKQQIDNLQSVLKKLNAAAGDYKPKR